MVLDLLEIGSSGFVVALSGALMPGPVLAVTLVGARERGFWFGPLVVLGHALVELPIVLLIAWGLGAVLQRAWIVTGIAGVGSAAMALMGVGMLAQVRRAGDPQAEGGGIARLGAVPSGAVTSLLNPYWYVWWVVIGAAMIARSLTLGWLGLGVFFLGHISGDLGWYAVVAFGVSRGRRYLQGRLYKALLVVCAAILLVMAVLFARMAVQKGMEASGDAAPAATAPAPAQTVSRTTL
jgi:threonine/homoserine/homoserine lactone efflux protein